MDYDYDQIAMDAFNSIKNDNPNIRTEISREHCEYVDMEMNIDAQVGLKFSIAMNLQDDTLHLHIGPFWGEWFSCNSPDVVKKFVDTVNGILSGNYRIKVISKNGVEVKALLQKPNNDTWECIYTWSKLHWPFAKKTIYYIQNKAS